MFMRSVLTHSSRRIPQLGRLQQVWTAQNTALLSVVNHARFFRPTPFLQAPKKTKEQIDAEEEEREMQGLIVEQEEKSIQFLKGERRCGLIGEKLGQMNVFDHWGQHLTVTVIRVDNHVIHHNEAPCKKSGLPTIKVGAGQRKPKKTPDWLARMCERAQCEFKQRVHDFPVTEAAMIPVGTELSVRHFLPGQHIDVQGVTIGRGFAGVMKRWGFKGLEASHGVSVSHRAPGSIGATGVGKVFKGKKMAGRMGGKFRTQLNCRIYRVDTDRNLIFVLGSTPGAQGSWVILKDAAVKKFLKEEDVPPMPTHFVTDPASEPRTLVMKPEGSDPFAYALT